MSPRESSGPTPEEMGIKSTSLETPKDVFRDTYKGKFDDGFTVGWDAATNDYTITFGKPYNDYLRISADKDKAEAVFKAVKKKWDTVENQHNFIGWVRDAIAEEDWKYFD